MMSFLTFRGFLVHKVIIFTTVFVMTALSVNVVLAVVSFTFPSLSKLP